MCRLTRNRPLLFTDLIRSDRHHQRFFRRDIPGLSDVEIWAERKLLEVELARMIWHRNGSAILGSDILTETQEPTYQAEWVRLRLRELQAEERRRLQRRVA